MPRPIVLGNGRLLIGIDDRYRIRDLFYPHVGLYNHVSGVLCRFGVWVGGRFAWADSDQWERSLSFEPDALIATATLTHGDFGISLEIREAVCHDADIHVRQIKVRNLNDVGQDIRVFSHHDLTIQESDIGDTAMYHPFLQGMVHFKGEHYFLFGGRTAAAGIAEYACGFSGTWHDAEDGSLSMKPIEQGAVESVFSLHVSVPGNGEAEAHSWTICGSSFEHLDQGFGKLKEKGVPACLAQTADYWGAKAIGWRESLVGVPAELTDFAVKSALIVEAHADHCGGVVAAVDSDIMETNRANYAYVWPRDGALIAEVMDLAGEHQLARKFFQFCAPLITNQLPFFLQKYRPDGRLGATWHPWIFHGQPEVPFQEDETALVLYALGEHADYGHVSELDDLFDSLVAPAADRLIEYRDAGGLPLPSYDLWEERRGVHTFTVATVVAGLRGAAKLAMHLRRDTMMRYASAAEEVLQAMNERLLGEHGYIRSIGDPGADASLLLLPLIGLVDASEPAMAQTRQRIVEELWVKSHVGGVARYRGDYYFRKSDAYPGNPWVICTLWLAQNHILLGDTDAALRIMQWARAHALPSGALPEQLHPDTGEALSVAPLAWAHAELLKCALMIAEAS